MNSEEQSVSFVFLYRIASQVLQITSLIVAELFFLRLIKQLLRVPETCQLRAHVYQTLYPTGNISFLIMKKYKCNKRELTRQREFIYLFIYLHNATSM
jgi:hypothetical protein